MNYDLYEKYLDEQILERLEEDEQKSTDTKDNPVQEPRDNNTK